MRIHFGVIQVLKDVNGQRIRTASDVLERVKATSYGALVDLGNENTILLQGIEPNQLTAANFQVVDKI